MVDYGRAFKRPFTDIKTLIIGIILQYIPIVNFIPMGYYLNCAATASKKDFNFYEFSDWGGLFVKGLLAFIIAIIYMLPFSIVWGATMFLSIGAMMSGGDITTFLASMGIGGIIAIILGIIAGYLLPLALTKYAIDGNFGAAFSLGTIIHKALTVKYLVTWIVMGIVGCILGAIFSYVFGILIFPFLVAYYTAIGEIYPEL